MTCSTSPCVTSLSRIATTPCEFKLLTWLPAIPAYTEWISQSAMSSASSTARWMDCTVDSILTTTPFLRPRDGWLPRPITSMAPSAVISPTSARTLEVPMSRPTMTSLSDFLAMQVRLWRRRAPGQVSGTALPAHGEAIAVAHVDVRDVGSTLAHQLGRHQQETLEACFDLLAPEPHLHAVVERHVQGPARVKRERHQPQTHFGQAPLSGQVPGSDLGFAAGGTGQLRQFGRHEMRVAHE